MDRRKIISFWILITGIIISVIGILHISFTPAMYQQMLQDPTLKEKAPGFAYFFAFCGFAIFYAGLLTIYSFHGLRKLEKWARSIAISASLFLAIGGISAIAFAKFGNLLIYVMCIGAVSNLFLLLFCHRN
jgi:glucan phosphoethanolaminetransferase (alkaline phosphatase superfamily)